VEIFVAGATGAVGRRLVPRLVAAGHHVVATTRSPAKAGQLRALGAEPAIMDGLDPVAVGEAVGRAHPEVVIHQMTQITLSSDLRHFDREFAVTNRLRTEGTDNLLAAATAAGARRFIAQSYAGWPSSRTGGPVKTEDDPLDADPPAAQRVSLAAIRHLENAVTGAPAVEGIVLRYGSFYGPGTGNEFFALARQRKVPLIGDGAGIWSFLHIDDAAEATVAALDHGHRGIYNITDDEPAAVADWLPFMARAVGAKPPLRIPGWLARLAAGEVAVSMMTKIRGSSNAKARAGLGWSPAYPSYRQGFPATAQAVTAVTAGPGQARAGKASDGRH
jgi:nucleoside-diphosphate-sugar epimerase